jgi:hypothetical protein
VEHAVLREQGEHAVACENRKPHLV